MIDKCGRIIVVRSYEGDLKAIVCHASHACEFLRATLDSVQIQKNRARRGKAEIVTKKARRKSEMRWSERSHEWQPVYVLTELGRALSAAGIGLDEYQNRAS
jgi:hypothetical protein